jgi:predicted RNase H-like nuclease
LFRKILASYDKKSILIFKRPKVSMTRLIGVDGCRGGWLALIRDLPFIEINAYVFYDAEHLFGQVGSEDIMAIDIPIGLTNKSYRTCDQLARKKLGWPRSSSIFTAPIRPALDARNRQEADRITRTIGGRGVGAQAFGIYKRVRDIDQIILKEESRHEKIFEVHPELSFMAWNRGKAIEASKKTEKGLIARSRLVEQYFRETVFSEVREKFTRSLAADDDITDAFACLWTAERINKGTASCMPDPPERDRADLPMAIYY